MRRGGTTSVMEIHIPPSAPAFAQADYLTRRDIELRLKVSKKTALKLMRKFGAVKFGTRTYRLPTDRLVGIAITTQQVGT